jgi:hypothetical protein
MRLSTFPNYLRHLAAVSMALLGTGSAHADEPPAKAAEAPFTPVKEADLPKGYPGYTKVGEIEVKEYPATRMARVKEGATAFWQLFAHIQSHKIEMSAPVQMDFETDAAGKPKKGTMAFLYGDPAVGKTGKDGSVDVVDLPAMKVVCIGMRGSRSDKRVMAADEQLRDWIKKHSDQYEVAGELRVMGYNSPFIAMDKQFYEVQIPVKEKK